VAVSDEPVEEATDEDSAMARDLSLCGPDDSPVRR